MPPFKDITGEQHGNLVVLGLSDHKYIIPKTGKTMLLWRVQCKLCGTIKDMTSSQFRHDVSCGCAFPIKQYRICPICGKSFPVSPSTKPVCCSYACGTEYKHRRGSFKGGGKWSLEKKLKRRADPNVKATMAVLQKTGLDAALALPEGQRGPQNREAKRWILIDPQGNYHMAVNLADWARKNRKYFFPDYVPEDLAARRICCGFGHIASTYRGAPSHRNKPASTYKGWRLAGIPQEKTYADTLTDNYIAVKEKT